MKESVWALIQLTALGLYLYGIVHAFDKHGNGHGIISFGIPPYAIYLGVEAIGWHDDYSNVNWEARLQTDTTTFAILLNASGSQLTPEERIEINKAMEDFGNQVSSYPNEKRAYLRNFAILFEAYLTQISEDAQISLRRQLETGTQAWIDSERLLELESKLRRYPGMEPIIEQGLAIKAFAGKADDSAEQTSKPVAGEEQTEEMMEAINLIFQLQLDNMATARQMMIRE